MSTVISDEEKFAAKCRLIGRALGVAFGENSGPYEDDPTRYGVAFHDGSMVDVVIVQAGAREVTVSAGHEVGTGHGGVRVPNAHAAQVWDLPALVARAGEADRLEHELDEMRDDERDPYVQGLRTRAEVAEHEAEGLREVVASWQQIAEERRGGTMYDAATERAIATDMLALSARAEAAEADRDAYVFLRDGIIELLDPPDEDAAEESIILDAVKRVADDRDRLRAAITAYLKEAMEGDQFINGTPERVFDAFLAALAEREVPALSPQGGAEE